MNPSLRQRRRLFVFLGVAAVLIAAGVLLAVLPAAQSSSPGSPPVPSAPAQFADTSTKVDVDGWRWADFNGVRLPYSGSDGPRTVVGDRAYGFAPSPAGALLAALHLGMRASPRWGPAVFEPTIAKQFTGSDRPALMRAVRATYDSVRAVAGVAEGGPIGRAYVVEEAFRWQAYTPGLAIVDVVTAGPGRGGVTVRISTRLQLVWRDDDWRMVAPPSGDWTRSSAPVADLTGYTLFPDRG
ncbi:hypothetical protein SAMN05421833_12974 [Microbispora rosea]|uniref:DUF8175 domain-containing protein n=1 Tax=Microbispora rosea TaxID=58117 RepID=A0A1N7GIX8_9ACTN|nr:hypothetical protein [Microbispora rosea]GIH51667.1 hypothetical protein Mro03_68460 [Microbispora rosea subsp. rosea]SIS12476.1 hypothetical protein SAMN05421833_12974 [Microbispora rosea]